MVKDRELTPQVTATGRGSNALHRRPVLLPYSF